ncbi:MAG: hypothetical protein KTR32_07715 [Granulosicoccus sp.]|nr:hypothetical protein [Granulosicoccus sp.]
MALPRFSTIRTLLLLAVLLIVGFTSAHQRVYSRNWTQTLQVTVYPINGDGHLATDNYIQSLSDESFAAIGRWGQREANRHNLDLQIPFNVTLGPQIFDHPPELAADAHAIDVLFWGLRFRHWAWRATPDEGSLTRIRMFVVYQSGEDDKPLRHSLGLQKGLMGLVYAFSRTSQSAQNNIVIAHELLHTVGAIDKYNALGIPKQTIGYANPARRPLFPQRYAEIMAGKIPTSPSSAYMAESLRSVVINPYTAFEINWLKDH